MNNRSRFLLEQIDRSAVASTRPIIVDAGDSRDRRQSDAFFVRRLRAIQWTRDCRTHADCTGARLFEEEALVELRTAMHPEHTFAIHPRTTALRLHWSRVPAGFTPSR